MGDKPKLKKGVYQNPNSERSKESIDRYVRGMRDKKYGGKRINTDRIRKFSKGMTPGQAKLAAKAPPPNKIDAKDFAVLRAEKAKGRGMGLQDEKVQPGKVMKAKKGKSIFAGYSKAFEGARDNRRVATIVGVKPNAKIKGSGRSSRGSSKINAQTLKASLMKSKNAYSDLVKTPKPKDFATRRKELKGAKSIAKAAGTRGKIALAVGAAGVGALQYLKSKMKKKDEPKKKMGGGMMQKPMGYNQGGMKKPGLGGLGAPMKSPKGSNLRFLVTDKDGKLSEKDTFVYFKDKKDNAKKIPGRKTPTENDRRRRQPKPTPTGYSKGTMVKARGCKLGRSKATKIT